MKKLLSLLLVVVMALGMIAGTVSAAEMPQESATIDGAGVKVTCTGNKEVYYFDTLTQDVISWACAELPGSKTITLQKDLDVSDTPAYNSTSHFMIPTSLSAWYENAGGEKQTLTFDLAGHTLSFTGVGNLFFVQRYGFTIKNGTIRYTCDGNTRSVVAFGTSTKNTATSSGNTVWKPKVIFENVNAFNLTEKGGTVITNFVYGTNVTARDSVLWSQNGNAIRMDATDQSSIGNDSPFGGDYTAQFSFSRSVVGSGKLFTFAVKAPGTVKATDTAFVTPKETIADPEADYTLDASQTSYVDPTWAMEEDGIEMSGNATIFGKAPGAEPLPFTDVKETDWFYSFVKQMYTKKVISGMSATTFAPNGTLTYGQALKLLVAAIGTDVGNASSGHWASNYLAAAQEKGWVDGDVNLDGQITRLSFCQIAAKAKELTEQPESNPFTDTDDTSVLALVNAGVINGMSDTTFAPQNTLTRAQIAKIIALLTALK